ncbi:DNA repair exonuclease [Candidatus Micrarchaeota archaeon]|nr:DNA repair exonuclease [Candidatus Micrarchaeota archaeon]
MVKFVHFADVHLGAFRDKRLRELNLNAFEKTIDYCIENKVDFVVIAGDLFDIAVPELEVVKKAAAKLLQLKNAGIDCFAIYGSHDYTPGQTSVVDVLNASGLLTKVSDGYYSDDGKLCLNACKHSSGVSFVGISARAKSIDSSYFGDLDLASLEKIPNPKIFLFHNTLAETKPDFLAGVASLPFSVFPKGFDYYAGGHVHEKTNVVEPGYGRFVFPGPLFAADYRDLEELAKHSTGFFLVELKNNESFAEFVELNRVCRVELFDYSVTGKSVSRINDDLASLLSRCSDSVVLLKLSGLLDGNVSEINFDFIRSFLEEKKCIFYLNRNALEKQSLDRVRVPFSSKREAEEKVFKELVSQQSFSSELTAPDKAFAFFEALKQPLVEGESKKDYESRIVSAGLKCF